LSKPPPNPGAVKRAAERASADPDAPEPWEELVPLGTLVPLPDFPVDTLPSYISAMAQAVATEVQVPVDLPAALAMGVLSTAAGGRAELVVRGQWREPLNLYSVVAMPPGAGKSPAFRLMCAPVFAAEKEMRETAKELIAKAAIERETAIAVGEGDRKRAKSAPDLESAIKAVSLAESIEVPVMPRLTADDITPEQAATIMAEQDGKLAVLSAEGTFFSVIMGRYTSSTPNLELVLKAHAADRVQVDRRGRSELIERPALTIATTVQPTVLREMAAKPAMRERGILARFLMASPRDLVGSRNMTPDLVPEEILHDYGDTMKKLVIGMSEWTDPAVILLSPGALKLHTEWRGRFEPRLKAGSGDLEALRDWASKLPGAAARIAGLLHLAETPDTETAVRDQVSEETMSRALEQADYWAEHAMAAFGAMRAHARTEDARAVLEWITANHKKEFSLRDVHRGLHRRFETALEAQAAMSFLDDHGYVRRLPDEPGRRGPKPVRFEVHPEAVTR
jgi:hypothetical protein